MECILTGYKVPVIHWQ